MNFSAELKKSGRKRELFMLYYDRVLVLFALFLLIVGAFHNIEVEKAKDYIRDGYQIRVEGKLLTDESALQMFASFYSVIASLVLPCLSAMEETNSQGMDRGYGNHTEEIKIIHN